MSSHRYFNWHAHPRPHEAFEALAKYAAKTDCDRDVYGKGTFIQSFEEEIADLLGMEAAVFFPTGVMAQLVALRIWSDRSSCKHVAFHPTSHLQVHEHHAYTHLHGLHSTLIGSQLEPTLKTHLDDVPGKIAALLVELPLRHLGGALPSWEELEELKRETHRRSIRLQMDGARLWEIQPYYQKSYAEICRGFDSVYVSFYKGIGGISGSMLLGPKDFIEEARIWRRRHGGQQYQLFPSVISAKMNFDQRIERFLAYYERAVSFAQAVREIEGIAVWPETIQSNMMHLKIKGSSERLQEAQERIIEESGIEICQQFKPTLHQDSSTTEIVIGDLALDISNEEIVPLFEKLVRYANS